MPKKGKTKAKVAEEDSDLEIIYKDTKSITGADPKFKWGNIYHMLKNQKVPSVGLEDLPLF